MPEAAATLTAIRDGHTFLYRFDDPALSSPLIPFERRVLDPEETAYLQELNAQLQSCTRERLGYQDVVDLLTHRTTLYFPHPTLQPSPLHARLERVVAEGRALTIETNDLVFGFDLTVIAGRVLAMAVPVTYKLLTPCITPDQPQCIPGRPPRSHVLLVANPSANPALRGAEAEVATLAGNYAQAGGKVSVLVGKRVNLATIAQSLALTAPGTVYIAGEFAGGGVPFSDGGALKPEHVLRYGECGGATVILNGCSSLKAFAVPFLSRGAAHLIGTSHDIADQSAYRFGLCLQEVSASGIHPSRWLHAAKAQYHACYPNDASPLFYHACCTTPSTALLLQQRDEAGDEGADKAETRATLHRVLLKRSETNPGGVFTFPSTLPFPVPRAIARVGEKRALSVDRAARPYRAWQRRLSGQPEKGGAIPPWRRLLATALLRGLDGLEDGVLARLRAWATGGAACVEEG